MTKRVLIAGAGKIGALISCLLAQSGDFAVHLVDLHFKGSDISRLRARFENLHCAELDVQNKEKLSQFIEGQQIDAVISSLPYFCNIAVAEVARQHNCHYFDLTEDVQVTEKVKSLSQDASSAFVPQCGLAPGFIGIAANSLMREFDEIEKVKLRVGALPQHASNMLQYALTWSTDGVINEYGNPCLAIKNSKQVMVQPLQDLEEIEIDGLAYEAFNTSGGLGSLPELYANKNIHTMNYKTIRYPGHCKKMRFLMNDLKLNQDRDTLKLILERAVPKTYQDLILIYVSVTGMINGEYIETNYADKVYPREIEGIHWSAIQVTTAAGICAIVDMVLANPNQYRGLVLQENFTLSEFLQNRFGRYYAPANNPSQIGIQCPPVKVD